jgi:hypothetical protein
MRANGEPLAGHETGGGDQPKTASRIESGNQPRSAVSKRHPLELKPSELRYICDPDKLGFKTTEELSRWTR